MSASASVVTGTSWEAGITAKLPWISVAESILVRPCSRMRAITSRVTAISTEGCWSRNFRKSACPMRRTMLSRTAWTVAARGSPATIPISPTGSRRPT
jgi:hypothetical protein